MKLPKRIRYLILLSIIISSTFIKCTTNYSCKNENPINCKFDNRKTQKDSFYTILILAYNKEFNLKDVEIFRDSMLVKDKVISGENGNTQFDPLRIELTFKKSSIKTLNIFYKGSCYKLLLLASFDNYLIEYDLKNSIFIAIANNEEFLTFE